MFEKGEGQSFSLFAFEQRTKASRGRFFTPYDDQNADFVHEIWII